MRAFIAIDLPASAQRSLERLQDELRKAQADVKWVESSQLHLTVKFLGEITDAQRQAVEGLLRALALEEPPFSMALGRLGAFASLSAPGVIWVSVTEGAERAKRLAERIEASSQALGLRQDARAFAAHVTLGRVRTPRNRAQLSRALQDTVWQAPTPWRVDAVRLYQSLLHSVGPRYQALSDVALQGAGSNPGPSARPAP